MFSVFAEIDDVHRRVEVGLRRADVGHGDEALRVQRAVLGDVLIAPARVHPLLLQRLVAELLGRDLAVALAEAVVRRRRRIAVVAAEIGEQLSPLLPVDAALVGTREIVRQIQNLATRFARGIGDGVPDDRLQFVEGYFLRMRCQPRLVEKALGGAGVVLRHTAIRKVYRGRPPGPPDTIGSMGIAPSASVRRCYPANMHEQPRPAANGDERAYTLTVEEAAALYEKAGFGRTMRAIQKYCARGDLDCIREQTTYGERFRITPASVARHIEQIEQLSQANRRDQSRPDANVRTEAVVAERPESDEPSVREQPRPDAAGDRYVAQLESEVAFLRTQLDRKDHQLGQRDNQIEAMIERDRETNILIEQLQRRIPMLPQSTRHETEPNPAHHTTYTEAEEQ